MNKRSFSNNNRTFEVFNNILKNIIYFIYIIHGMFFWYILVSQFLLF